MHPQGSRVERAKGRRRSALIRAGSMKCWAVASDPHSSSHALRHPRNLRLRRRGRKPVRAFSEIVRKKLRWRSVPESHPAAHSNDMKEQTSERLVDQRIRNRIMEAVETLADGDEGVRCVWPTEYFENFYDCIHHRRDGEMRPNSAINPDEAALLREVSGMLDDACDATPRNMTPHELIATGWPKRIQPVACKALALMRARGRFSEEKEEEAPSG